MKITLTTDDVLFLDKTLGVNALKDYNSKQMAIVTDAINNNTFLNLSDLTIFLEEVEENVPALWNA